MLFRSGALEASAQELVPVGDHVGPGDQPELLGGLKAREPGEVPQIHSIYTTGPGALDAGEPVGLGRDVLEPRDLWGGQQPAVERTDLRELAAGGQIWGLSCTPTI